MFKLNYDATGLDLTNALCLAEASLLSYEDKKKIIETVASQWGFSKPAEFIENKETDTQCFIAANDKAIILSFRGTELKSKQDIEADLYYRFTKWDYGRVHSGFLKSLNSVWDEVEAKLKEMRDNNQSLWVTGHSLGGALAHLAVATLLSRKIKGKTAGLYTFGQPRVGDKGFADKMNFWCNLRMHRFVNHNDIVTRLPIRLMGYKDLGNVEFFTANGTLSKNNGEWLKFLADLETATSVFIKRIDELIIQVPNWVMDHDMGLYKRLIEKNIKIG